MEVSEVVNKFKELVFNDTKTQNIRKTIRNGGSYMDVEDYAKRLAELMAKSLEGIPEGTDLVPFLQVLGEVQRKYINSACEFVQKTMNEAIGVDLNPILAKSMQQVTINTLKGKDITEQKISEVVDSLITVQKTQNLKLVDTNVSSNADFQSKSGLKVKVSRYYDDVGLRNRTQKCAWCLSRCGVDVDYDTALKMGMFERHEGCGCKIVYKSERTSYQTKKGAWKYE